MSTATVRSLPAGPQPANRNALLMGTAAVCAAGTMLMFGMLAVWFKFRDASPLRESARGKMIHDWLPSEIKVPEVAANTLMITMVVACIMAQWGVYSARRNDSSHTTLALVITGFIGVAAINAQAAIYMQMGMGLRDGTYQTMFYAITGTMLMLLVSGVAFSLVAMFRATAGRIGDKQVMSAHAMYWYFLTTVFCALWFVVYVQK
jgi:heme/copper-type cytochrome/quinol oxidase subunit 3